MVFPHADAVDKDVGEAVDPFKHEKIVVFIGRMIVKGARQAVVDVFIVLRKNYVFAAENFRENAGRFQIGFERAGNLRSDFAHIFVERLLKARRRGAGLGIGAAPGAVEGNSGFHIVSPLIKM